MDQDRDVRTILTALTLEKINPEIYTIAELLNRQSVDHMKMAGVEDVIIGDEISSNIIASSIRSRGLIKMVHELFTVRYGMRFHKMDVPATLIDKTFIQGMTYIKKEADGALIAIEREADGKIQPITNPPSDELLKKNDKLVIIAHSQSKTLKNG